MWVAGDLACRIAAKPYISVVKSETQLHMSNAFMKDEVVGISCPSGLSLALESGAPELIPFAQDSKRSFLLQV